MKLLMAALFSVTTRAERPLLHRPDAQLHLFASAAVTSLAYAKMRQHNVSDLRARVFSAALALSLGLAKEALDPTFSRDDLAADAIGIAGTIVVLSF